MSRITLTKKRNGRYYLGVDAADFQVLKEILTAAEVSDESEDAKIIGNPEEVQARRRLARAVNKLARGE